MKKLTGCFVLLILAGCGVSAQYLTDVQGLSPLASWPLVGTGGNSGVPTGQISLSDLSGHGNVLTPNGTNGPVSTTFQGPPINTGSVNFMDPTQFFALPGPN